MQGYTYQIGDGTGGDIAVLAHSETLYADSLIEAIDKAKAITNARAARDNENTVCLLDAVGEAVEPVWIRPIGDVRA